MAVFNFRSLKSHTVKPNVPTELNFTVDLKKITVT